MNRWKIINPMVANTVIVQFVENRMTIGRVNSTSVPNTCANVNAKRVACMSSGALRYSALRKVLDRLMGALSSMDCTVGVKCRPILEMYAPHHTANIAILLTPTLWTTPPAYEDRTPNASRATEYCSGRDARNVTLSRKPRINCTAM